MRALVGDSHTGGTWVPSTNIAGIGEIDFAIWRKHRFGIGPKPAPELVLGEAKTFDRFETTDVQRLFALRSRLGTGFVCFATLRTELESDERRRITRLARVLGERGTTPPVMILTARELWRYDLAESLAADSRADSVNPFHLDAPTVCAITQDRYLPTSDA
jgi:hypothetical protein